MILFLSLYACHVTNDMQIEYVVEIYDDTEKNTLLLVFREKDSKGI